MLGDVFSTLGLSSKDEQIYLAALEIGSQPASIIARKAEIKRGDAYNHLKNLSDRGLFKIEYKNGIKHFCPCPPKKLLKVLRMKRLIVLQAENKLKMLIPILDSDQD